MADNMLALAFMFLASAVVVNLVRLWKPGSPDIRESATLRDRLSSRAELR